MSLWGGRGGLGDGSNVSWGWRGTDCPGPCSLPFGSHGRRCQHRRVWSKEGRGWSLHQRRWNGRSGGSAPVFPPLSWASTLQAALQTQPCPGGQVLDMSGAATVTHPPRAAEPPLPWGHIVISPLDIYLLLFSKVGLESGNCKHGLRSKPRLLRAALGAAGAAPHAWALADHPSQAAGARIRASKPTLRFSSHFILSFHGKELRQEQERATARGADGDHSNPGGEVCWYELPSIPRDAVPLPPPCPRPPRAASSCKKKRPGGARSAARFISSFQTPSIAPGPGPADAVRQQQPVPSLMFMAGRLLPGINPPRDGARPQRKPGWDFVSLPLVFALLWPCQCWGPSLLWLCWFPGSPLCRPWGGLHPHRSPWTKPIPPLCVGIRAHQTS